MKKNPPRSRSKRPTAPLDLKAKEVQKNTSQKDVENSTIASSAHSPAGSGNTANAASGNRSASGTKRQSTASASQKTKPGKNDAKKEPAAKTGNAKESSFDNSSKNGNGTGGFISHLLASVIGAVLGVFGLTYANNQNLLPAPLQISTGQAVKQQIVSLNSQISRLQKQLSSNDANVAGLATRLAKTETSLGGEKAGTPSLTEKVSRLETTINNLEKAAQTGKGGQLAGLTAVTKQLATSNKQALALKTEFIKLREEQNTFREDLASIRSAQADFQSTSAKISDDLAKMRNSTAKIVANASRPPDVSSQINPVMARLDELTARIDGVINREASSKAEGRDIALALSLGELKRAVNEGTPYKSELARIVPHAPKSLDLSVLSNYADKGLVTRKALRSTFSSYSHKALASQSTAVSGSFVDQIMANAKSMIQVRPTGLVEGDTVGAILSRMEYKLDRDDLAGALKESQALRGQAKDVMQPWLAQTQARLDGDTVLRSIEDKIRNSLAGGEQSKG
jgi:hypothetical protein